MKYGQTTHFLLNIDAEVSEPTNASNPLSDTAKLRGEYSETGELVYDIPEKAAKVTVKRRKCDHAEAVVQQVTVKNEGAEAFVLDSLSSLFVSGIGEDGGRKWYDHRFIIHYCHSVWQGEGQWRSMDIVDAGLYPTYNHGHQSLIRLSDIGSMSTRRFYPMLMLEDRELGEIWYFELEASSSWYIEVSVRGCQDNSSLCVFLSTAHEKNDGWYQILKPHEEYTSSAAAYGCVKGGFEAAVRELTAYKRERSLVTWRNGVVPVCFNDYMNCLWALPTSEKLIPLIDKAAEAGCEVFCIDDGWYRFPEGNLRDMGTWLHNDALFGEYGFCGIIEYIKNKGMRPGIWLELESAMIDCEAARNIPDALLMRHGKPVGKQRCFLNFRSRGVREYVLEVIDRLYGMGVRYIKNDYNQSAGVGVDSDEFSSARALAENTKAFLDIIDEVRVRYPDLPIENCGSGAMRCDNDTLRHFIVQSTSDQEFYENYPSIIQGMLALLPPEKAGVWAYPYPVPIHLRDIWRDNHEFAAGFADGNQTVFNMVTGMFGCMYMSGKITNADELNMSLIKEATELYKKIRKHIPYSSAVYPTGLTGISEDGFITLGLLDSGGKRLLLGVWKKNTEKRSVSVDISRFTGRAEAEYMYPRDFEGISYRLTDKCVEVAFPERNSAAFFVLRIK